MKPFLRWLFHLDPDLGGERWKAQLIWAAVAIWYLLLAWTIVAWHRSI